MRFFINFTLYCPDLIYKIKNKPEWGTIKAKTRYHINVGREDGIRRKKFFISLFCASITTYFTDYRLGEKIAIGGSNGLALLPVP